MSLNSKYQVITRRRYVIQLKINQNQTTLNLWCQMDFATLTKIRRNQTHNTYTTLLFGFISFQTQKQIPKLLHGNTQSVYEIRSLNLLVLFSILDCFFSFARLLSDFVIQLVIKLKEMTQ